MNTYNATGNIVADAESVTFESGSGAAKFRLAVSSGYGDKKKSVFWKCTMFGERGQRMCEYLTKGKKVAVTAEIEPDEWEKDGVKHSDKRLIIREIEMLDKRETTDAAPSTPPARPASRPATAAAPARKAAPAAPAGEKDDLPF